MWHDHRPTWFAWKSTHITGTPPPPPPPPDHRMSPAAYQPLDLKTTSVPIACLIIFESLLLLLKSVSGPSPPPPSATLRFADCPMRHKSDGPAPAPVRAATSRLESPSRHHLFSARKVRPSDHDLYQCVQRVVVPHGPVNLKKLSSKRGWKRVRRGVPSTMNMYCRVRHTTPSRQCQVAVDGELRAPVSEVLALLRAPTESESNALLRALFGTHFIYSSLLYAVPSPCTDQSPVLSSSPPSELTGVMTPGQQLTVRTVSFARKRRLPRVFNPGNSRSRPAFLSTLRTVSEPQCTNPSTRERARSAKNEQCCYVELFTPTVAGFKLAFCTLEAADVFAGKAPPERVIPLHLMTGWLVVEPSLGNPDSLRLTFHAAFPGKVPDGCDAQVALSRLKFVAKGLCQLEKVLRRRRRNQDQPCTPRDGTWQTLRHPFRAMVQDERCGGTHRNWHCIACTRSFFPTFRKCWRRCDLCAYRVCDEPPCCSRERVAIYNRYIAPLTVCARCRECIDEQENESRASGNPVASGVGDVRYTGVSLQFADRESKVEPESEVDSSGCSHDGRWGSSGNSRFSRGGRIKRNVLPSNSPSSTGDVKFSSSGDDERAAGAEARPGASTAL
uniref:FYVE-type domain-containing protein n=1 Tax=Peronospora matthiolae TaxID=2874970 RepID=A0AAV1TIG4_9STRA